MSKQKIVIKATMSNAKSRAQAMVLASKANGVRESAYFIDRAGINKKLRRKRKKRGALRDYSRVRSNAKSLAPAKSQAEASSLIFAIRVVGEVSCLLKIRAFRSFQTSHMIKRGRLLRALRDEFGVVVIKVHHSRALDEGRHALGRRLGCASHVAV
ncbi:uncharacterized protein LOC101766303 isoform X1 [Setaria italica]|uniref:uncharacterized protein LOC101766303 isoform X1 n=1 Tax=Setaria italica TaxID=4555 RepID=UPI000BE548F0|nr:uncharacterized protein LOC101766303 isoform X1 [Setaria italica]